MMQPLYAVYGASGCGREVMPLARQQLAGAGIPADRLVFIDDNPVAPVVNGRKVLRYGEFLAAAAGERYAVLAIADGGVARTARGAVCPRRGPAMDGAGGQRGGAGRCRHGGGRDSLPLRHPDLEYPHRLQFSRESV